MRIVNAIFCSYSGRRRRDCQWSGVTKRMTRLTALTQEPCAAVARRMFAEADASVARLEARANIAAAGLADLVEIRCDDALDTLAQGLPEPIDLVFLHGAKSRFVKLLGVFEPRLRNGSLVMADNAEWRPGYLAWVRDVASGYRSTAVAEGLELSL
jgi:hypothetical protein